MKNLMKWLFKLIFFIPRLIFALIWSLVKTAVLVAILLFGLWYFANQSGSSLAERVSDVFSNISFLQNSPLTSSALEERWASMQTDFYNGTDGSKWSSPKASVYLASTDSTLISAYETAIANWNATGSFTFQVTTDAENADIIATDYVDASTQAAGLAETQSNLVTNTIKQVTVKLNRHYLFNAEYGYDFERIVHTAEHELGHAMGLSHNDSQPSVMQSAGSSYGIQPIDTQAVYELYQ